MNILELPDIKIIEDQENANDRCFTLKHLSSATHCPNCGFKDDITRWGTQDQFYFDLPLRSKRVAIKIKRQRWMCKSCNTTFFGL